uniref:Putative secreted protein n=1 Tax=Ixodes ricinus TaxID=34613 RepID=A0A6B0UFK4_IXORI
MPHTDVCTRFILSFVFVVLSTPRGNTASTSADSTPRMDACMYAPNKKVAQEPAPCDSQGSQLGLKSKYLRMRSPAFFTSPDSLFVASFTRPLTVTRPTPLFL